MTPSGAVAPAAWLRDWRAALLIVAVGFAVLAPEFVTGPSTSDSLRYNIVWLDQWRELVAAGDPYPRWMPRAWDGMGSPAFYFYPPLFFWLAVGLDQLTARLLETGTLLSLASALLLGASGLAMRAWLRAHVGAKAALLGGVAYMLAPYHLYDIFARAAMAETCAYAALPLVMLALKRAGEGSPTAFPALAVTFAALIVSHLPVALLVTVVLLPAYALFLTRRPAVLAGLAGAGLLGAGLAAIYLLPALALNDTILAEAFSTSFYRPQNWFFWHDGILAHPVMWIVLPTSVGAALLALSALPRARPVGDERVRFWSLVSLVIVLLVAGVPPAFWNVPGIVLVQFPWRLLVPLEFAAITTVALAAPRLTRPFGFLAAVCLIGALGLVVLLSAQRLERSRTRSAGDLATIRTSYRDAPEYLPAGYVLPPSPDSIPNPSAVQYPRVPLVQARPYARVLARPRRDGGIIVDVASAASTPIVARRFAHGPWRIVDGAGRIVSHSPTRDLLIRWTAPAGSSRFHLRLGTPGSVRLGQLVSGLSLLALLLLLVRTRARQRRAATLEAAP